MQKYDREGTHLKNMAEREGTHLEKYSREGGHLKNTAERVVI